MTHLNFKRKKTLCSNTNYIIYAPPYDENSGGSIMLHYLCHTLRELGEYAYMWPMNKKIPKNIIQTYKKYPYKTNLNFNTPVAKKVNINKDVVIYPEIVDGNPLNAKNRVRWFLNNPGFFISDTNYGENELYFFYEAAFNDRSINSDETNKLTLLLMNSVYKNWHLDSRNGVCYSIRKGKDKPMIHDVNNSTCIDKLSHEQISKVFNNSNTFISYDIYTMYSHYAAICGCDSIVVPHKGLTKSTWISTHNAYKYGIAYGFKDIEHTKKTKNLVYNHLKIIESDGINTVISFIAKTKKRFSQ